MDGKRKPIVSEKEINKRPIRILIAGFIVSVLVLMAFSIISFVQIRKERTVSDWIVRSFTIKLKLRESVGFLIYAQAQHRAFLLTADSMFYQSFESSGSRQKLINRQLDSLIVEYKAQSDNLQEYKRLSERRFVYMEQVLDSAKVLPLKGLAPMLMKGAETMDSLNRQVQIMEKLEDEHLKFRLLQKDNRERNISSWMLGFSIIALATIVVSFLILRTQRFRLSKAEVNKIYLENQVDKRTKEITLANKKLKDRNFELKARNSELKNFAFISSHDMKEPLRKVDTFLKLILESEGEKLSESSKEYANGILASTQRMNKLIRAILVYMQATRKKRKQRVDLNEVIEQSKMEMKKYIDEKAAIISHGDLPIINGIQDQLQSMFCTFVSNSLKFSERRPKIEIKCESDFLGGHEVWKLVFSDNGIGFDMIYKEKIFQIFQRLHSKDEYPGTGLGLALAKRIAENHGGLITVHSEIGKGSIFTVFIPKEDNVILPQLVPIVN
jgi:signal transduction histidine kinase